MRRGAGPVRAAVIHVGLRRTVAGQASRSCSSCGPWHAPEGASVNSVIGARARWGFSRDGQLLRVRYIEQKTVNGASGTLP